MKRVYQWTMELFIIIILIVSGRPVLATIDVEMILNNGGFVSFDHFKAELYLFNHVTTVPGARIFGILELAGEFYYWPDFETVVNYRELAVEPGETYLTFLEFDFPDIDDVIPFGPMNFWGAWYVDAGYYGYDVKEFWLDEEHKWTPTPMATFTPTPTQTPTHTPTPLPTHTPTPLPTRTPTQPPTSTAAPPTSTAAPPTSTPTSTPTVEPPFSVDPIVGNMRYVPSGTFTQGSPETEFCRGSDEEQFTHTLTRNILVMETEITRQMWVILQSVQGTLPDERSDINLSPTLNHALNRNTWYESVLFANLLSVQNGYVGCYYADSGFTSPIDVSNYTTGPFYCDFDANGYRLPLEGEWEYFTRAGTTTTFSCNEMDYHAGNCSSCVPGHLPTLARYSVFCPNSSPPPPAGSKLGNPWNLKDVHGNVLEWCWDWYEIYPTGSVTDYTGGLTGVFRMRRGGCSYLPANQCRSAFRTKSNPEQGSNGLGFRLVRVAP